MVERVTAYLFLIAQYVLISTLVIPLTKLEPKFQLSVYVIMIGFMTYAINSMHGVGWWRGFKALFLTLISFIIYVIVMNAFLISFFSWTG